MDWLARLLGLPNEFLACSGGSGGGVIQVSIYNVTARHNEIFSHLNRKDHLRN
jgi:hypothetical protein